MSSSPDAARDDNLRVIDKHKSRIRERGLLEETMAAYYANVGRTYIEDGDVRAARRYLVRSLFERFRLWYAGLFLLTILGTGGARRVIDGKRWIERRLNCPGVGDG